MVRLQKDFHKYALLISVICLFKWCAYLSVSPATWSLHQPSHVRAVGFILLTLRQRPNNSSSSPEVWTSLWVSMEVQGGRRTCAGLLNSRSLKAHATGRSRSASCRDSWTSAPACVRHSCRTSRLVTEQVHAQTLKDSRNWQMPHHSSPLWPLSTDAVLYVANPADWSVQCFTQQCIITTSSPGHAPAQPVLHPAGLAAKQRAKVKAVVLKKKKFSVMWFLS